MRQDAKKIKALIKDIRLDDFRIARLFILALICTIIFGTISLFTTKAFPLFWW